MRGQGRGRAGATRPEDGDEALHARLVHGDAAALGEAYDLMAGVVHAVALRVSGSRSAAEDIVQEVFVHLWSNPYAFRPERGTMRGWLCMLAHRRAVDWVRAEEARDRRLRRLGAAVRYTAVPSAEDSVVAADEAHRVRAAVGNLPAAQREAIELAFFAGNTYRQVAERLGVPEGTVKSRMRVGLRQLAVALAHPARPRMTGETRAGEA
ncbi:sigma-70 family RNA polymerase sigma factor [Yinghuangia seranimata]|uniref:sigma-70 family RNA polymerase sigma factor n=1 Tax=Yinghuangia seranimata TaxID=408067 RepID=UPI00248D30EC|nr:sigma-70 family RNA polymerase sigma factor [Yinghuangia seranimata]MDI2128321.1 sigma-70 family RNA polymerase sigma factor [Yinghuangia seranimata]